MNKLFRTILSIILLLNSVACDKNDVFSDESGDPLLLSRSGIIVSSAGRSVNLGITSQTADWTITGATDWCSVSPTAGPAGTSIVEITISSSILSERRSTTLTVTAGDNVKTVNIIQKSIDEPGDDPEENPDADANRWIYSTLGEWYLWNDEILAKTPFYNQGYESFFNNLLISLAGNSLDGRYNEEGDRYLFSKISRTALTRASQIETTYGFGVGFVWTSYAQTQMVGRITYVQKGSPADRAGLKRGTWIHKIAGQDITEDNYLQLLSTATGTTSFSTCRIAYTNGTIQIIPLDKDYTLTAEAIGNNPIVQDTVLMRGGKKVGYLAYNSFSRGYNDYDASSVEYETELRNVFSTFRNEGVEEFVLDLRYNPGGLVVMSQLLGSLICPQSAFGETFALLTYNDDKQDANRTLPFLESEAAINIDMDHIYIITSTQTASASELLINGLRGIGVQVTLVGGQTVGKNVGSDHYTSTFGDYVYAMDPITFLCSNAAGSSSYSAGFYPNYTVNEWEEYGTWYGLGDQNEIMLQTVLELIDGTALPLQVPNRTTPTAPLLAPFSSSDLLLGGNIILPNEK